MKSHSKLHKSRMNQVLLAIMLSLITLTSFPVEVIATQDVVNDDILFDPLTITVIINANGSANIQVAVRASNIGPMVKSDVSIRLDSLELSVLSAMVNGISTDTSTVEMDRHTMVVVNLKQELDINESVWINLELLAFDLQSSMELDSNGSFLHGDFVFYLRPHTPLTNFTFTSILPSHASLSHESSVPLFPQPDVNFSNGESMAFTWFTPILQPGQESAFIVRYQEPNVSIIDSGGSLFTVSFIGILGVFIGVGLTRVGPIMVSRLRRMKIVRYLGITQEEEIIIDNIKSKGGSCSQKELYRQLKIGESKLSLILSGLEERGLIKRFREGRENVVHLIETSK